MEGFQSRALFYSLLTYWLTDRWGLLTESFSFAPTFLSDHRSVQIGTNRTLRKRERLQLLSPPRNWAREGVISIPSKGIHTPLSIPRKFRHRKLKSLLYTSDLLNRDSELKEVLSFGRPLKLKIKILHLLLPVEALPDKKPLEIILRKKFRYDMEVVIIKDNIKNSIRENLEEQIKLSKPSIIVMFTDQSRSIFQKLFYPSKAEQLSFTASVPLLTFPKSKSWQFPDNNKPRLKVTWILPLRPVRSGVWNTFRKKRVPHCRQF